MAISIVLYLLMVALSSIPTSSSSAIQDGCELGNFEGKHHSIDLINLTIGMPSGDAVKIQRRASVSTYAKEGTSRRLVEQHVMGSTWKNPLPILGHPSLLFYTTPCSTRTVEDRRAIGKRGLMNPFDFPDPIASHHTTIPIIRSAKTTSPPASPTPVHAQSGPPRSSILESSNNSTTAAPAPTPRIINGTSETSPKGLGQLYQPLNPLYGVAIAVTIVLAIIILLTVISLLKCLCHRRRFANPRDYPDGFPWEKRPSFSASRRSVVNMKDQDSLPEAEFTRLERGSDKHEANWQPAPPPDISGHQLSVMKNTQIPFVTVEAPELDYPPVTERNETDLADGGVPEPLRHQAPVSNGHHSILSLPPSTFDPTIPHSLWIADGGMGSQDHADSDLSTQKTCDEGIMLLSWKGSSCPSSDDEHTMVSCGSAFGGTPLMKTALLEGQLETEDAIEVTHFTAQKNGDLQNHLSQEHAL